MTTPTGLRIFLIAGVMIGLCRSSYSQDGGHSSPYFQADYIQDLSDWSSAIVNPALIYRVNQAHFQAGFYRWNFGGVEDYDPLGYQMGSGLLPIRLNHTVGLSFVQAGGKVPEVLADRALDVTGANLYYGDWWIVGHYAYKLPPIPSWTSWLFGVLPGVVNHLLLDQEVVPVIGVSPKMLYQNQFTGSFAFGDNSGFGFGLDLGAYINLWDHYRFGDLGFSINFQDIVPAQVTWQSGDGNVVDHKQLLTTRFRTGLRYGVFNDRLIFNGEYVLDNAFSNLWAGLLDSAETAGDAKDELERNGRFSGHLRYEFIPQVWLKGGWANNNIPYLGFNLNLIYPILEVINFASADVHVGYSFLDPERGERGLTFMGKFSTDFGPTREQRESKRLYDMLILAPMNAYNEAMRLYLEQRYWEAQFAFGKVMSLFPNFHLNDKATYYMGDCYSQLHLNDLAREVFKEGLSEYTTSEVRPKLLYGLQEIDYREGKSEETLRNHAFISNLYGESEVKAKADYLAAEVHFQRKNYNAAEKLLSGIGPEDETYLFAQYTLSVVNIENGKEKAAIQNLQTIIADTTSDPASLLLQDAAANKLGQLYFEQVQLRQAVEAFDRVPEGSIYGDEALLGIAWSWIKVNRPEQALRTVDRLIAVHPNSPLVAEAYLVRGYSLMLQQKNESGIAALEKSLELARADFDSEEDLTHRQREFERYMAQFAPIAQQIKKNALRKPTESSIAERAQLEDEFEQYTSEARSLFDFATRVEQNQKFFRRKDQIIADAEYALAKANRMIGTEQGQKAVERERREQQKIDEELEKLKEQLKELE